MQTNLEKRVVALEAKKTKPVKWVWRDCNETTAQALARAGILPTDKAIVFSWRGINHANT